MRQSRRPFQTAKNGPGLLGRVPQWRRDAGIALMVVFVVFTILVVVVFQLQYSTKLEEELAEVRSTASQGSFATVSVIGKVLSLLSEDYETENDSGSLLGGAAGLGGMTGMLGANGMPGGGNLPGGMPNGNLPPEVQALLAKGGAAPNKLAGTGHVTAGEINAGDLAKLTEALGGISESAQLANKPTTKDYIHESVFLPTIEDVNDLKVKVQIRDNERAFDLNHLWTYPQRSLESLEDLEDDAGLDPDAASEDDTQLDESADLAKEVLEGNLVGDDLEDIELNFSYEEWIPPDEDQRDLVRDMIAGAIEFMIERNQDYGFYYEGVLPNVEALAWDIEDFCYFRRDRGFPNTVSSVTELLVFEDMTPELFYGPVPFISPEEEFYDLAGEYSYQIDEFGDLIAEYLYLSDDFLYDQDERGSMLEELQGQFGLNQSFPGLGGLMGSSLTRNMEEIPEHEDGLGLAVAPKPIGVKDLFCTKSSGLINLNTAPSPVIFGLLAGLDVRDDAIHVAQKVEEYRNLYQEEMSEEEMEGEVGVEVAGERAPSLGQPRREIFDEEEDFFGGEGGMSGFGDMGFGDMGFSEMGIGGAGFQNAETNYFTEIRQIELVDGWDTAPDEDLLFSGGVRSVSAEDGNLLQQVLHFLVPGKNVSFGSNYFTATLKLKTKDSPTVKEGSVVVYRDTRSSHQQMTVLQWNEFE